ncbi:MAG: nucleotidyltransferase domain-containing protein [Chloroflexi bacterium]|nr:nucleotidyltransferase domain-containing protein [Chloroflexota bacterium]
MLRQVHAPYLVGEKREALAQFLSRLEFECAEDVLRVILFGSQARGDADDESDVDLMIVARNGDQHLDQVKAFYKRERVSSITALIYTDDEYRGIQAIKLPLYVNVRRDGIELWDPSAHAQETQDVPLDFREGEFRMLDYETIETIRLYVREFETKLRLARDVEKTGQPGEAVSPFYYAAFYLTTAALYTVNVVRGKHQGVSDAVNQFLVKPGLLEQEYAKIYTDLMEGRQNVDYRPQKAQAGEKILSDDELRQFLRDGERYIERMKRFLVERGIDESDFK